MLYQNQVNYFFVQFGSFRGFAVLFLLITLGLGNAAAPGQTAAGDGQALDANQARRSGRLNTPRERFRLNDLNNAIVTGNVAGGKGFRGELGYSAAGDFRDVTGSNDLFSVSASSYLPGLIYQRYGFLQVPTNRVAQNARYQWSLQPSVTLDRSASGSSVLADPFARQRRGRQAVAADPTGSLRMVVQPGRVRNSGVGAEVGMRLNSFGGSVLGQTEFTLPYNFNTLATTNRGSGDSFLYRSVDQTTTADGVFEFGLTQPAFRSLDIFGMSRGAASATAPRGLPQTDLQRGTPSEQRKKQALESASGSSVLKVGADPYADLVAEMIRQVNSIPFEPGQVVYSETMLEAIRRFNAQFALRGRGNDNPAGGSSGRLPSAGGSPLLIPGLKDLRQLESNTLPALGGDADSEITLLTRAGETALGAAKFFVAERVFIRILEGEPENQLALAGLAHAQLGAGLFRSSALSIRTLFTRYPELAGIKFAAKLKPSRARLGSIIMNLRQLRKTNPITDWGLLLAYTGRLAEDPIAIREGLDFMGEADFSDPVLELLRAAWLAPEEVVLPDEERGEGVRFGEEEPGK